MAFTAEQVSRLPEWLKDFYRSTGAIETPDPEVDSPVYQQAPYRPQYVRPRVQGDMRSEGDGQIMPSMPMDSEGMFDIGGSLLAGAKGLFDGLTNEVTDTYNSIGNFVSDPSKTIAEELGFSSPSKIDNRAFANTSMTAKNIGNLAQTFSTLTGGNLLGLAVQGIAKQFERSDLNKDLARLTGNDPQRIGFLEGLFSNQEELARDYLGAFSAPEDFAGIKDTPQWTAPTTWQNPDTITNLDTYTPPQGTRTIYTEQGPITVPLEDDIYNPDNFKDGMFYTGYGSGMDFQGNVDGQDDSGYGDDDGDFGDTGGGMDDPDY